MEHDLELTTQFKKDMKLYKRNKKVKEELDIVIKKLRNDEPLDDKYRNHKLKNREVETWDCHILPNVALLYSFGNISHNLILRRIGSHNKLGLTESVNSLKLTISEDTACIASKTSYIEDGFDKNGIYYFGKKPNLPVNWKDYKKDDNKKFKLKESDNMKLIMEEENMVHQFFELDSKPVRDSDGFWSEYTMYMEVVCPVSDWVKFLKSDRARKGDIPDEWIDRYVFIFGDRDMYEPEDGGFDWECESEKEAYEWFDNYNGFEDEDEEDNDYSSNWNGY
ncbi:MAG: type II toxin-antitoxin system YafQ family toxin [Methanobrevibacter sp.]|nr:type II toxin-antitoxin system YafQ family toxin [Methanobrevibacter sp.]MBO7696581.1 type II toxin-antitoxin system YafQ family toxin [Methanobrevibacter sp.]